MFPKGFQPANCTQSPSHKFPYLNILKLWERVVLILFLGCLLLFLHAFIGRPVADGGHAVSPSVETRASHIPPWPEQEPEIGHGADNEDLFFGPEDKFNQMVATEDHEQQTPEAMSGGFLPTEHLFTVTAKPDEPGPISTSTYSALGEDLPGHPRIEGQAPTRAFHILHRFSDPRHDPFDLELFFDTEGHGSGPDTPNLLVATRTPVNNGQSLKPRQLDTSTNQD